MKRILIISTLALIVILELKAQNYVPFPTDSASWNIYHVSGINEAPDDTSIIRYMISGGDTLINSKEYHKLLIQSSSNSSICIGGIREEAKKVYYSGNYSNVGSDVECILYDFNALEGDTIEHYSDGSKFSIVLSIDSILIDGNYRKRFTVEDQTRGSLGDTDYIIEGIGSVKHGLLENIMPIPSCVCYYYSEHICFKENDEVKYLNPNFSDCDSKQPITSVHEIKLNTDIIIKDNQIIIHSKNQNINSVKLITPEGKLLSNDDKLNTLFYNKSINYNGLLICVVTLENGEQFSKKIIVTEY